MNDAPVDQEEIVAFGPFRLSAARRALRRDTGEVALGGRAFDILITLIDHAGEVVTQRELMQRVWPGVFVEEANLRVHIASLRKALGDGQNGARYIENVPRRGYCFVAPVVRGAEPGIAPAIPNAPAGRGALPPLLTRMIGRDATVATLVGLLADRRFVSIVGAGGLGKTTVALSAAHALLEHFDGAVFFADLGALAKSDLVDAAVASALGFATRSETIRTGLLAYLRDRRCLIVLDNCEHVIDIAATLAEQIVTDAPDVSILATSREALRAEGEYVHLLDPLDNPPLGAALTAAEAMAWPAVQLFVERAAAGGWRGTLDDGDAPLVGSICSRLDGIALAIELAASRVAMHGIRGTADLLNHRFKLLWQGRRSALPRHQTMQAMLDWSYNLLSEQDRVVLARLSVFVGIFTLSAAQHVAVDPEISPAQVAQSLASLTDKSLIWASTGARDVSHRLPDVTRTYAAAKLEETGRQNVFARRHAIHYSEQLALEAGESTFFDLRAPTDHAMLVNNARAALDWAFAVPGRETVAVALAARTVPLFIKLSLLNECQQWCESALTIFETAESDAAAEVALREGLAISTMFTRGNHEESLVAIHRGLALARALGSAGHELRLLAGQHIFMTRIGDFRGAMAVAERSVAVAERVGHPGAAAIADWMLGTSCHLVGDQLGAQTHCEAGFRRADNAGAVHIDAFGYDHHARAQIVLARALWLRGFPDRAARLAARAVTEAEQRAHPIALCTALIYTTSVAIWSGDLDLATQCIDKAVACAEKHGLEPYRAVGRALRGEVSVLRGDIALGIAHLRDALAILEAERHFVLATNFMRALAEGLLANGEGPEALTLIDRALSAAQASGEAYLLPDLLRVRGEILANGPRPLPDKAEECLLRAIADAHRQTALGLELRATVALARFWSAEGRASEAADMLGNVLDRFTEGAERPSMRTARVLLQRLRAGASTA